MKKILKNSFFKSILTLASGTLLAQLITFLASPIITRIYTPEEIGIYTMLITAVGIFGGVVNGRYDMSIVYEEEEANILTLIKLSVTTAFLFSLIVSLFYSLYYVKSSDVNISLTFVFVSIFILLLLSGINNTLISFNNRHKDYKLISSVGVYQSLGREITTIILGLINQGVLGLTISQIIGRTLGAKRQSKSLVPHWNEIKKISTKKMYVMAKKHKRQPIYSVPAIFANSFSYSSINIFVDKLYGASILGFYSISFRVLGLPLTLVSNNVSKVYFEKASEEYREKNNYKNTFIKTTLLLLFISIPMVIILILLSPSIFSWFYGKEWRIAGKYVQILAPMFGIRLIVSPLTPGMLVSNKQNFELLIQILFVIISTLSFWICKIYSLDIELFLLFISVFFSLTYICYYLLLYKLSTNKK